MRNSLEKSIIREKLRSHPLSMDLEKGIDNFGYLLKKLKLQPGIYVSLGKGNSSICGKVTRISYSLGILEITHEGRAFRYYSIHDLYESDVDIIDDRCGHSKNFLSKHESLYRILMSKRQGKIDIPLLLQVGSKVRSLLL